MRCTRLPKIVVWPLVRRASPHTYPDGVEDLLRLLRAADRHGLPAEPGVHDLGDAVAVVPTVEAPVTVVPASRPLPALGPYGVDATEMEFAQDEPVLRARPSMVLGVAADYPEIQARHVLVDNCAHPDFAPALRSYLDDVTTQASHIPQDIERAAQWDE